jgi:hypothetical protein
MNHTTPHLADALHQALTLTVQALTDGNRPLVVVPTTGQPLTRDDYWTSTPQFAGRDPLRCAANRPLPVSCCAVPVCPAP